MSIAELAIRRGTLVWSLSVVVLILGWQAYLSLPRLDEPKLAGRDARVITSYPGASAAEVEQEVSTKIEEVAGELGQLGWVESRSSRGLSVVGVHIQDAYDARALPRVWEELRRKVEDLQPELPPGAGPSIVDDDLGDLFGSYYGLSGEGFTEAELKQIAELLRHELSLLEGVKRVLLFGERRETLSVEISRAKTASSGIGLDEIFAALGSQGLPVDAGRIRIGPEDVAIQPTEPYPSEQDFGDLMIAGGKERLVRLGDIAEIRRDYEDPPRRLLRLDGRPAIGIAVSIRTGHDLVATGKAIAKRLAELTAEIPLGMELKSIALQWEAVSKVVEDSVGRLVLAAGILMAALLILLGWRSGLAVGLTTLLTIAGTFAAMDCLQLTLDRVSLGALVVSLGLIPGSAVLVVQGMKVCMNQGVSGVEAAHELAGRQTLPLAGAAAAVVLAFAPIGGMDSRIGDFLRELFLVVAASASIGWMTAMTAAPLLADRFLLPGAAIGERADPRNGRFYRLYGRILAAAIGHRRAVLGTAALLVALSLYGFSVLKQVYLPLSDHPTFLLEAYFREGTHIRETARRMDEIQAYLRGYPEITQVATAIGADHPVYLQTQGAGQDAGSHYGASLVAVENPREIDAIGPRIQADLEERYPDAVVDLKRNRSVSEFAGGRIALHISGPDPAELRRLADQVETLIAADSDARAVRDDWGAKVKVAQPVLAQGLVRRLGIDRARISAAFRTTYSGSIAGFYRDEDELIPIVVRAPRNERGVVEDMADIQVTSPLRGERISMLQLVDRLDTVTEDARRVRRGGARTISVLASSDCDATFALMERIKPRVEKALGVSSAAHRGRTPGLGLDIGFDTAAIARNEKIPLRDKPGYFIGWGGEVATSAESRNELLDWAPLCLGSMLLILVSLFNALRQPLIVLATVPLALIGAVLGLLLGGQPFDFMSLIGILGLSGMLIAHTIPLVDRIDCEIRADGKRPAAVLKAATSCLHPLGVAAVTSALALSPLLVDDLYASLAVTLISGLGLSVLATPILVPVLYATLFQIRDDEAV